MPPRFAFWTIILDGAPTSFRTRERDEILPLFNQLKAKNPTAELKWFSGGKLWDSPEQAKEVRHLERVREFREERRKQAQAEREAAQAADPLAEFRRQHGRPPDGSDDPSTRAASAPPFESRPPARPGHERRQPQRRGKDWRPGGEHKDPRDKYKLPPGAKRQRWKDRNLGPRGTKPFDPSFGNRPGEERPHESRPRKNGPFGRKPFGGKPAGPGGPRRFGSKPGGGPGGHGHKPGAPGREPGPGKPSSPRKPFGGRSSGPRSFDRRPPRGRNRRGPK